MGSGQRQGFSSGVGSASATSGATCSETAAAGSSAGNQPASSGVSGPSSQLKSASCAPSAGVDANCPAACCFFRPNSRPKTPPCFSSLLSTSREVSVRRGNRSSRNGSLSGSAVSMGSQGCSSRAALLGAVAMISAGRAGTGGSAVTVDASLSHSNGFKNSAGISGDVPAPSSVSQSNGLRNSSGISVGSSWGSSRGGMTGPFSAHSRIAASPPVSSAPPENVSFQRDGLSSSASTSRSGRFSRKVSGSEGAGAVGWIAAGLGATSAASSSSSASQLDAL